MSEIDTPVPNVSHPHFVSHRHAATGHKRFLPFPSLGRRCGRVLSLMARTLHLAQLF